MSVDIGDIDGDLSGNVAGRDVNETTNNYYNQPFGTDPAVLEEAYLNHLMGRTRRLSLLHIDPKAQSDTTSPQLNLDTIYTALLTRRTDQSRLESNSPRLILEREQGQALSALDMLNRHPYLVLLGDPGSGKSTFVNFVVLCLAGARLKDEQANLETLTAPLPRDDGRDQDERQPWDHGPLLPVRVILREFAASGLPEPSTEATSEHLWNYLVSTLPHAECAEPLRQRLLEHGGLILLDGLDEVPEANARRVQIKQTVTDLVDAFPKCRILVTSRGYAYQRGDDWLLPDFEQTLLDTFSQGQIRRFVDRWHGHMAQSQDWSEIEADQRASRLKDAIFERDHLLGLAQRPLLLTLMCLLHTYHGSTLPDKRADLYEQTVDLLLHRWERRQLTPGQAAWEPSLSEWLRVDRDQVRAILNEVAYNIHTNQSQPHGPANIDGADLEQRLLALAKNDPDLRVARLREYLDHRAGILLPLGDNVFSFPHRTFQEYLAAYHITEMDEEFEEALADLVYADASRWREVALLAAAKARRGSPSTFWGVVEALCEKDVHDSATASDLQAAVIAGEAMVETANLDGLRRRGQRNVDRVRGWLIHILDTSGLPASERVIAGRVLATLGDERAGVGMKDGLPDLSWCAVPAGTFTMGEGDEAHPVDLADFQMSRYTITNAQFAPFTQDSGYTEKWRHCWTGAGWQRKENDDWQQPALVQSNRYNQDNQPVVGVSWYEAVAYCRWLTERLHEAGQLAANDVIRLPTEAEWEKAARGTDGQVYPWEGNEADPDKANYEATGIDAPCAVGAFVKGQSPFGCQDMSGNVWEWCATEYGKSYPYDMSEDEWADDYLESFEDYTRTQIRGGAYYSGEEGVRAAFRSYYGFNLPIIRVVDFGFRVVCAPRGSDS